MARPRPGGFLAGLACGAGALLVFGRRFRRRHAAAAAPDPADELRRKLAETRAPEPPPASPPEPAPEPEPAPPPASVDERRSAVHERGRSAIDRMRGGAPPPP